MIRQFLIAILLAAVFSAMCRPLYLRLIGALRGRERSAAVVTLLFVLLVLVAPAVGFMGLVVSQAVDISQAAATWVRGNMDLVESVEARLMEIPLVGEFLPDRERVVALAGRLAQSAGGVLVDSLRAATLGTTNFLFQLFLMLYAMFFFLVGGPAILDRILYLMPLSSEDEHRLLDRFVSVTRATIKGSLVIGVLQGGLAGLSFFAFGIPGAAFWGTVMAVLSIVPALGTALVWVPAVIWLLATGQIVAGVAVGLWCGARGRHRRQLPAAAPGRPRHQASRPADPAQHLRRDHVLRGGRIRSWADRRGTLRHRLGNLRGGVRRHASGGGSRGQCGGPSDEDSGTSSDPFRPSFGGRNNR